MNDWLHVQPGILASFYPIGCAGSRSCCRRLRGGWDPLQCWKWVRLMRDVTIWSLAFVAIPRVLGGTVMAFWGFYPCSKLEGALSKGKEMLKRLFVPLQSFLSWGSWQQKYQMVEVLWEQHQMENGSQIICHIRHYHVSFKFNKSCFLVPTSISCFKAFYDASSNEPKNA